MNVLLTVEVEFFLPDNPLVITPKTSISRFNDETPSFTKLVSFLKGWFAEEIETDLSMVRVWCDKVDFPTILLPKTIWNSEARLIVGKGVTDVICERLQTNFLN